MWEFAVRLLLSGLLVAVSGWTGLPGFDIAWKVALATSAYGFLAYVVDSRGMTNPGFAGLIAGLDALAISAALGFAGVLEPLGSLVIAPIAYAVTKRGSNPLATGPIGSGAVVTAFQLSTGGMPTMAIWAHAAIVLAVALLVNQPRVVVRPQTIQQMITEIAEPHVENGTQALIEMREKYRRLSSNFKELERRSRIDRIASQMLLGTREPGADYGRIIDKLRVAIGADGMLLCTTNKSLDRMVVAASAGYVPDDARSLSFEIKNGDAAIKLRDRAETALRAIGGEGPRTDDARSNVLLKFKGNLVGMLTVIVKDHENLEDVRRQAEEASEPIAQIIADERERRKQTRRTKEAELMYEIAARLDGATTEADLGKRTAKALSDIIRCEHIGVWLFDGGTPLLIGRNGKNCHPFESLTIGSGGASGWLAAGGPVVSALITADSPNVDRSELARQRINSLICVPILEGDNPVGMLTAAAAASGSLTNEDAKTMRDVAAELSHVLMATRTRKSTTTSSRGILSAAEFQREVVQLQSENASLVYVEPLKFQELESEVGRPALENAARQLGLLLRRHAPNEAKVCRKSDGSYVVLLPEVTSDRARSWAGEVTGLAAMQSIESADGRQVAPLAVRARAAGLNERIESDSDESSKVAG